MSEIREIAFLDIGVKTKVKEIVSIGIFIPQVLQDAKLDSINADSTNKDSMGEVLSRIVIKSLFLCLVRLLKWM